MEGRVAFVEGLPVLVFDVRVQVEDTLDQSVEEGVDVLARVDHRLLHFHLVHRGLGKGKLIVELLTEFLTSQLQILKIMILMSLLKHAIIAHELLILPAKVPKLHVVMNWTQQPRRMQVKFGLIVNL